MTLEMTLGNYLQEMTLNDLRNDPGMTLKYDSWKNDKKNKTRIPE